MIDLQCQGYMKGIIANPLLRASATAALVCLLWCVCFAIPALLYLLLLLLWCVCSVVSAAVASLMRLLLLLALAVYCASGCKR